MSVPKEFFDSLDETLEQQAKDDAQEREANTWEPENAGDTLKGIFLKVNFVADKFNPGEFKPVVIIKDKDTGDSTKVWGSRKALKSQLVDAHPLPGTPIGIRYGGFTLTPDGDYEGYHSYTVVMPDQSAEEDKNGADYWTAARGAALEEVRATRENRPQRPDEAPF